MAQPPSNPLTQPRSASPSKHTLTLPGIPEATPGPNAFAQQAARMERHRFDGNAFYQQEVQKRKVTPPNSVHPAFRTASGNQIHAPSGLMISSQDPRESTMTTMSAFINAGTKPSPPMNLVPSDGKFAEPTNRGFIEDRREEALHEASGSDEERVPVYQTFAPTPKPSSSEFMPKTASSATPRKPRLSLPKRDVMVGDAPKSPKKGFFDKLRMTKLTGAQQSPSTTTLGSIDGALDEPEMPVKARAVLGSPSKSMLTRTPSKQKKGLFSSRRPSDVADLRYSDGNNSRQSTGTEEPPLTASTQAKTPQTATSDPTHYSYVNGKRVPSQTLSDRGGYGSIHEAHQCIIQRSQSLKYIDNKPPPTPPAKNTPPHQKGSQEAAASSASRMPFQRPDSTLSKETQGILTTSDRLSPTKFGGYAHKETPMLITKPSMYSLHASVVPEMMEATTFEEMKARFDGLALEGFDMPDETHHPHSPEMVYSPSVYGSEWGMSPNMSGHRPSSMGARTTRSGFRASMGDLSTVAEAPSEKDRAASHRTKQSNSSSGGSRRTIPIIYPELASDPSVSPHMLPQVQESPDFVHTPERPMHGHTYSRDHSETPRHSRDISLFAMPMGDEHDHWQSTPASFSHPSAMPSPLHYLPATVYSPPPPKTSRKRTVDEVELAVERQRGSGLGIETASPSHQHDIFQSAPSFPMPPVNRSTSSPRQNMSAFASSAEADPDSQKVGSGRQSSDKQDEVLALLNTLINRNSDVDAIRDELRATNARLDARLAAIDGTSRSSSPNMSSLSLDGTGRLTSESSSMGRTHTRVATNDAHEFYRLGQSQSQGPVSSPPSSYGEIGARTGSSSDGDRIAELTESNRRLTEMVHGMASQLEELKGKMGGEKP